MKTKFPKVIKMRLVLFSLILGIVISWLMKDGITLLVTNGKSFNNRSFSIQISILILLIIFTSSFLFFILSILSSFYARNEKLQQLFKKMFFNNVIQPVNLEINKEIKEAKIRYIVTIILIGFVTSVFFHYFQGVYQNLPYPHNTFLFLPSDKFNDFFNFYNLLQYQEPYFGNHQSVQYPFSNLIGYAFTILPRTTAFIVYTALFMYAFIIFAVLFTYPENSKKHISELLIISLLTYPILFTLDRGNPESYVFISLLGFIYFYEKKEYLLTVIFLSSAIAMKLFPIVFVIIYLSDKKYKEVLLTGLFTCVLTIFSLLFFKGGIYENLVQIIRGANLVRLNVFLGGDLVVQRGVSLFTLAKIFFIETDLIYKVNMAKFLSIYIIIAVALGLFIAVYVVLVEKEFWKKVAILVVAMLLLPHVSADYKLIHIFLPLFLFINTPRSSRLDGLYIALFGLLLIPKDYYLLSKVISDSGVADISISVIINDIVLITMLLLIMGTGLKNWISPERELSVLKSS